MTATASPQTLSEAGYHIEIAVQGYPGKAVCHGGLGWSTIALLRGHEADPNLRRHRAMQAGGIVPLCHRGRTRQADAEKQRGEREWETHFACSSVMPASVPSWVRFTARGHSPGADAPLSTNRDVYRRLSPGGA